MKITKVVINSFGAVSNWHSPELKENLTFVYGDNEAGKSTIMEFIRGTMFPVRTVKYPLPAKTDSGTISVTMDNGDVRTLKREQKKVTEADGKRTVAEEFSNLDAETYRALYAMDIDQLTNSKVISSGSFRDKFLTVPGGENVPSVSKDIDDRLDELMNKEKMTDSKIIGKLIKEIKNLDSQIAEMQKSGDRYDALVAEKQSLLKKIEEAKTLSKMKNDKRARKSVLMAQAANVDQLKSLQEQRSEIADCEDIPLESKEQYDRLKERIDTLTDEAERTASNKDLQGNEPAAVTARTQEIEEAWSDCNKYISTVQQRDALRKEIDDYQTMIDSYADATGWSEKAAKRVKTGKYITDKAEAVINNRATRPAKVRAAHRRTGIALTAIGIALAAAAALFSFVLTDMLPSMITDQMLLVVMAAGAAVAVVGIALCIPHGRHSVSDPEDEWQTWIAQEGYPEDTTPEKACILGVKLETMANTAKRRDDDLLKVQSENSEIFAYETKVGTLCKALGVEHTNYRDDVDSLYSMLKAANAIVSESNEFESKKQELADAQNLMRRFLRRYGSEEEFVSLYDKRKRLEDIDSKIKTLTQSIEMSSKLSVTELIAFYNIEGDDGSGSSDQEDDGTADMSRRIGEIDAELKSILDDDAIADLRLRRADRQTDLDTALREWAVCSVAAHIIGDASKHFYTDLQPSVVKRANRYLSIMTNGRYQLDSDPRENNVRIKDANSRKTSDQWSSGLGDQVYLSVKMAMIKEMGAEKIPLVMDDVLLRFDTERKQAACRAIYEFSADQQVIMFSCDKSLYNFFALEGKLNYIQL
jgi:hypothetical protein